MPVGTYRHRASSLLATSYFPARYFLHKAHEGSMLPAPVGLLTPAIGVVAVAIAYGFWRIGLNRYSGVGH